MDDSMSSPKARYNEERSRDRPGASPARIVHRPSSIVHRLPPGNRPSSIVSFCLAIILLAGCTTGTGGSGDKVKLVITPVDTPTTTPLAAPTMAPTTYTVKAGDTLSGIAALFGVSVDDIVRANNIADPNRLSEGQALTIPVRPSGSPTQSAATPKGGTPNPSASPALPPPNVTPPLGPPVTEQAPGAGSSPVPDTSPTAIP
jgi:LysM repeat protein